MAKQTFTTGQVLTAAQMTSLQQTAMGGGSPSTKTASYVLVAADAGTVIQMNAVGSTTITVNTALFSAGDSVQIQNIGAGVCTITAGTATVNTAGSLALSQWEGGFLYFTSASSAIFFDVVQSSGMTNPMTTAGDTIYGGASGTPTRLAIGSTGNVLTVSGGNPVWAAPAGGGGMTLLSTTSLSGTSTSVSITGTGYVGLYITVGDMSVTQAGQMYFRLNSDSGANQYRWTGTFLDGATNALSSGVNTAVVQSFNAETTETDMYWNIQIFNSEDTATYKAGRWMTMQNRYSDGRIELEGGIFSYQSTSAITNFTLFTGTAGTFSAGSIKVYGVK